MLVIHLSQKNQNSNKILIHIQQMKYHPLGPTFRLTPHLSFLSSYEFCKYIIKGEQGSHILFSHLSLMFNQVPPKLDIGEPIKEENKVSHLNIFSIFSSFVIHKKDAQTMPQMLVSCIFNDHLLVFNPPPLRPLDTSYEYQVLRLFSQVETSLFFQIFQHVLVTIRPSLVDYSQI